MSLDLISVVIPTYNNTDTLYDTLESVFKQKYTNFEIWVVDDGSTSDLTPIISSFNSSKLHYIKQAVRQNANVARNEGIKQASGKYIAMLDADDQWTADHLSDCLATIKRHNADGLYGSVILKKRDREWVTIARRLFEGESMIDYLLKSMTGAQTSTLFMTAESAKNTLWDPALKRHQDYDFVVRYSKKHRLVPKIMPTVLYNISTNKKSVDYHSCIAFIERNKNDISPEVYTCYHQYVYDSVKNSDVSESIKNHYKSEACLFK